MSKLYRINKASYRAHLTGILKKDTAAMLLPSGNFHAIIGKRLFERDYAPLPLALLQAQFFCMRKNKQLDDPLRLWVSLVFIIQEKGEEIENQPV